MGEEDGQAEEKSSIEAKQTTRKIIRVITVIAYLCSVSMAAIMLSLYYLFFWNPAVRAGPERLVDTIHLPLTQFYSESQADWAAWAFGSGSPGQGEVKFRPLRPRGEVFHGKNRPPIIPVFPVSQAPGKKKTPPAISTVD